MAHYALIDKNNLVVDVITGVDENLIQTDLDGTSVGGSSESWEDFYSSRPWFAGLTCKRTSYNAKIRKNFAGIGYTYDAQRDAFIPPKPFPSWLLDEETCLWVAPIAYPTDGLIYNWNEEAEDWEAYDEANA